MVGLVEPLATPRPAPEDYASLVSEFWSRSILTARKLCRFFEQ
jgi:hypothetical protein